MILICNLDFDCSHGIGALFSRSCQSLHSFLLNPQAHEESSQYSFVLWSYNGWSEVSPDIDGTVKIYYSCWSAWKFCKKIMCYKTIFDWFYMIPCYIFFAYILSAAMISIIQVPSKNLTELSGVFLLSKFGRPRMNRIAILFVNLPHEKMIENTSNQLYK